MQFDDLTLVEPWGILRLYSTAAGNERRYHFGFPKDVVTAVGENLIEAVWENVHWHEDDDGFWLYALPVVTSEIPRDQLQGWLAEMRKSYARVATVVFRWRQNG